MNTHGLLASQAIIIRALFSPRPHGPSSFSKSELSVPFTESVNPLARELEVQLKVLVGHEEVRLVHVDESVISVPVVNKLEAKWGTFNLKTSHFQPYVELWLGLL